jgi:hypothetical protein
MEETGRLHGTEPFEQQDLLSPIGLMNCRVMESTSYLSSPQRTHPFTHISSCLTKRLGGSDLLEMSSYGTMNSSQTSKSLTLTQSECQLEPALTKNIPRVEEVSPGRETSLATNGMTTSVLK